MRNAFDIPTKSVMSGAPQARITKDTTSKPSGLHIDPKDDNQVIRQARFILKDSQHQRAEKARREFGK